MQAVVIIYSIVLMNLCSQRKHIDLWLPILSTYQETKVVEIIRKHSTRFYIEEMMQFSGYCRLL